MNLCWSCGEEHSRTPGKRTVSQQYNGQKSKLFSWMFLSTFKSPMQRMEVGKTKTIVMVPLTRYARDIIPTRQRSYSEKCNSVCFMVLLTQLCKQTELIIEA